MDSTSEPIAEEPKPTKLSPAAHVMCGWPLLLMFVGGAVGGGLGGAAYGINTAIYKSTFPTPAKIALNVMTGVAAIGIWLAIAITVATQVR